MGIKDRLKKEAMSLSQKAMERLFADEQRAMKIAAAIGKVQRGKQALERSQDELLRQLNFAPRGELKALGRQLSSLKRRVRDLDQKLAALAG